MVFEQQPTNNMAGVMKEEHIYIRYKHYPNSKTKESLCLRKVTYRDEKGRIYEFINNNFEISAPDFVVFDSLRWVVYVIFS
jgi:hypothetical protein